MGCPGGQPFFATENCGRRKRIAKDRFAEKTCRKRPAEKNPGKVLEYLRILRYIGKQERAVDRLSEEPGQS